MKDFNHEMYAATIEASILESVHRAENATYWDTSRAQAASRWVTDIVVQEALA